MAPYPGQEVVTLPAQLGSDAPRQRSRPLRRQRMRPGLIGAWKLQRGREPRGDPFMPDRVRVQAVVAPQSGVRSYRMLREVDEDRAAGGGCMAQRIVERA